MLPGVAGVPGLMIIATVLFAIAGETQVALDVIITFTTSPLFSVLLLKVEPVAPAISDPFNCH
jgi:hypothetical protein